MKRIIEHINEGLNEWANWAISPVYGPSLSLRPLVSEQYGRRSFTSIVPLLVLLVNIEACCCTAAQTERQTDSEGERKQRKTERDIRWGQKERERVRDVGLHLQTQRERERKKSNQWQSQRMTRLSLRALWHQWTLISGSIYTVCAPVVAWLKNQHVQYSVFPVRSALKLSWAAIVHFLWLIWTQKSHLLHAAHVQCVHKKVHTNRNKDAELLIYIFSQLW